ncbi:MAG: hypothetical protein PHQ20_01685 [Candidatus Moranbacteria bacterium]|jgi:hypothetical protein|nr:hypothetical protein [Candidatus Moranbacteria bacterium]
MLRVYGKRYLTFLLETISIGFMNNLWEGENYSGGGYCKSDDNAFQPNLLYTKKPKLYVESGAELDYFCF